MQGNAGQCGAMQGQCRAMRGNAGQCGGNADQYRAMQVNADQYSTMQGKKIEENRNGRYNNNIRVMVNEIDDKILEGCAKLAQP